MEDNIPRSEEEWQQKLTPGQYEVLRKGGTEPAFSGKYYIHKAKGIYVCGACGAPLFSSDAKYDSGCGWPSFYQPIIDGTILTRKDTRFGMVRTEIICARCKSHLGHVFDDGPQPTGLRYCVNSIALDFKRDNEQTG